MKGDDWLAAMSRDGSASSPSSDYRRQLRAQCLDQHSRLQQQHGGPSVRRPPVRSSTFRAADEEVGLRERHWTHDHGPPAPQYSALHRSNSSLELDRGFGSADPGGAEVMRRDYGSVNSLDKVDCFSTILRNYRQSIEDGLQHAGGTLEKLSGRHRDRCGSHSGVVPSSLLDSSPRSSSTLHSRPPVHNGFLQPSDELGSLLSPAVLSPKSKSHKSKDRKTRSESGGGGGSGSLFRKLRGVKSDPYSGSETKAKVQPDSLSSGGSDPKLEDRIRRKAFCHYDCQSIGVNLSEVVRLRSGSGSSETCLLKRTNTSTGASAASAALKGLSEV